MVAFGVPPESDYVPDRLWYLNINHPIQNWIKMQQIRWPECKGLILQNA